MFSRNNKSRSNQVTHQQEPRDERKGVYGNRLSTTSLSNKSSSSAFDAAFEDSFGTRFVKADDEELAAIASDTRRSIDWRRIMQPSRGSEARWRRQATRSTAFAVYLREELDRHGVLSVGDVPGCAAEILNVLQCQNSAQYTQNMEDIYGDEFKEGSLVHCVDVHDRSLNTTPTSASTAKGYTLNELSVKTVAFNKAGWFADHEEWCYVDAVFRNGSNGVIEKVMKTIEPKDIIVGLSGSRTKYFHDVSCGYSLSAVPSDSNNQQPEEKDGQPAAPAIKNVTRVMFFADFHGSKTSKLSRASKLWASEKMIKQRLFKLAESTTRLTMLVRRQRLGLQTLVDNKKFLPVANTSCKVCTRMLMIAKLCRLCGQSVCRACSAVHERSTQKRGDKLDVAQIRVCTKCLHRVDNARYENVSSSSLLGSHIHPDPVDAPPASVVLKDLLQHELLTASSPSRKASVISVIKSLLGQDHTTSNISNNGGELKGIPETARAKGFSSATLPVSKLSSDAELVRALEDLEIAPVSACETQLRTNDHRSYQIDTTGNPEINSIAAPLPVDEEERLQAVKEVSVDDLVELVELSILCDVAAQEMGCTMSTISVIDQDNLHVLASNVDALRNLSVPRNESMCSHTIMENKALIVPHPEADIRFNKFGSVDTFDVRYYCGFPLVDASNRIIGSMCCVNDASIQITESQFATFQRLATTASKIVRIQTSKKKRQRALSTASKASE